MLKVETTCEIVDQLRRKYRWTCPACGKLWEKYGRDPWFRHLCKCRALIKVTPEKEEE